MVQGIRCQRARGRFLYVDRVAGDFHVDAFRQNLFQNHVLSRNFGQVDVAVAREYHVAFVICHVQFCMREKTQKDLEQMAV